MSFGSDRACNMMLVTPGADAVAARAAGENEGHMDAVLALVQCRRVTRSRGMHLSTFPRCRSPRVHPIVSMECLERPKRREPHCPERCQRRHPFRGSGGSEATWQHGKATREHAEREPPEQSRGAGRSKYTYFDPEPRNSAAGDDSERSHAPCGGATRPAPSLVARHGVPRRSSGACRHLAFRRTPFATLRPTAQSPEPSSTEVMTR